MLAGTLEQLGSWLLRGARSPASPAPTDPGELLSPGPITIYLHIPFCASLCTYCTFDRVRDLGGMERYVSALEREIASYARHPGLDGATVSSIFVGGGTPSLLPAELIERVLAAIRSGFRLDPAPQITLEANPESVTAEKLARYRAAGVDRISLGVQTFEPAQLRRLGRRHGEAEIDAALALLREAGFAAISLDLMYGLPGQRELDVMRDVERAIETRASHISVFPLIHRPGAPLARSARPPTLRRLRSSYLAASSILERAGFDPYTPEDFAATSGARCAYQTDAWRPPARGCLGLGSSALSGFARGTWRNLRLERYTAAALDGRFPISALKRLSRRQAMHAHLLRAAKTLELRPLEFERSFDTSIDHAYPGLLPLLRASRLVRGNGDGSQSLSLDGRFLTSLLWTSWILDTLG